jgi:hypothetical protein
MTSDTIQPIRGAELRKPATDAVIHYLGGTVVRVALEAANYWRAKDYGHISSSSCAVSRQSLPDGMFPGHRFPMPRHLLVASMLGVSFPGRPLRECQY